MQSRALSHVCDCKVSSRTRCSASSRNVPTNALQSQRLHAEFGLRRRRCYNSIRSLQVKGRAAVGASRNWAFSQFGAASLSSRTFSSPLSRSFPTNAQRAFSLAQSIVFCDGDGDGAIASLKVTGQTYGYNYRRIAQSGAVSLRQQGKLTNAQRANTVVAISKFPDKCAACVVACSVNCRLRRRWRYSFAQG